MEHGAPIDPIPGIDGHVRARRATAAEKRPRVLLADDDVEMCRLIATALRRAGYGVTMCANGINLLDHLGSYIMRGGTHDYSLIITDIRMPGVTGMEVLEGLRHVHDAPPIVLITAFGDRETHREARRFGALAVLDKPFDLDHLIGLVRSVIPLEEDPNAA